MDSYLNQHLSILIPFYFNVKRQNFPIVICLLCILVKQRAYNSKPKNSHNTTVLCKTLEKIKLYVQNLIVSILEKGELRCAKNYQRIYQNCCRKYLKTNTLLRVGCSYIREIFEFQYSGTFSSLPGGADFHKFSDHSWNCPTDKFVYLYRYVFAQILVSRLGKMGVIVPSWSQILWSEA